MATPKDTGVTSGVPDKPVEALPVANLISADEVAAPEVKTWKYQDLAQKEPNDKKVVDAELKEKIRQEMQPEIQKQAEILKAETYEKAHAEGYEAGFIEGSEAGKKQAYEAVEAEAKQLLSEQVKSLQNLIESMGEPYQLISESVFESLSRLALEMAAKVVEVDIQLHQDWVLKALHEAIAKLPEDSEHLDIQVHPDDLAVIEKYQQTEQKKWRISADSDLPKGSCRVKHKSSVVVNNWQLRLKSFMEETDTLVSKLAVEPDSLNSSTKPTSQSGD
ncbi:hypothetical protein CYQ88_08695 [Hydrogenovibrio sp. SC-1]|uniref:FliH/SctL family protein n=1 Tax=Hydrogenovibrio sp. SC-1 TaxID=2065820 RepID=UPI000C79BC63|nr:FliH/SctL family protein [Hydrogenovibrio sp. SC-1]PLA73905.1 hypothetical protein CYQ88_08695 [Hydrogenovibrio sp. SC-1]